MVTLFKRPGAEEGLDARIAGLRRGRCESEMAERTAPPPPPAAENAVAPPLAPAMPEAGAPSIAPASNIPAPIPPVASTAPVSAEDALTVAREELVARLSAEIRPERRALLSRSDLAKLVSGAVQAYFVRHAIESNPPSRRDLIADETVNDIMVNGPKQVYVERRGKLELTDVQFRDDDHLMNVATKIVTRVGRRIDEARPLVDARLPDGSRVNIIIPPLALDGASISIRKFSKKSITLDTMAAGGSISPAMATVLKIAARTRLNILISGGTGSGKTTLLNALSRMIDSTERTVTIEDAAELQLQQPHVVRLETRTANLEGTGEITMRDLLKNALRMRPDRIIIGECRGEEALDMLQAMNTGHDGSMSTIHANNPREALTRLENMIGMAGINLPSRATRTQIASAVHLICQVNRMRDGARRVTQITEVVGMEGDIITTQDLFTFQFQGEGADGKLRGTFSPSGIRPAFLPRAEYYGLDRALLEVI